MPRYSQRGACPRRPRRAFRHSPVAGGSDDGNASARAAAKPLTVGFIFVGPKDDFGYNQAAYEGSQAVEEAFPDLKVLRPRTCPRRRGRSASWRT